MHRARRLAVAVTLVACAACRASLPAPSTPLSATRADAFDDMPQSGPHRSTHGPSTQQLRLNSGFPLHVLHVPGYPLSVGSLVTHAGTASRECAGAIRTVTVEAWRDAMEALDPGARLTAQTQHDHVSISFAVDSAAPSRFAATIRRVLEATPNAAAIDRARRRAERAAADGELGGAGTAVAVLNEWRTGERRATTTRVLAVEDASVVRCLATLRHPDHLTLAASGGLHGVALQAELERSLSGWAPSAVRDQDKAPFTPPPLDPPLLVVNRDVESVAVAARLAGPGASDGDYPAFAVLAHLFGQGGGSRMSEVLRGRLGLTYWAGSDIAVMRDASSLTVRTLVDATRLNEALRGLDRAVASMRKLTDGEISAATVSLRERWLRAMERPALAADEMASRARFGDDPGESLRMRLDALAALTPDAVRAVADRYFRRDEMPIVVVGHQRTVLTQLQWSGRSYDLMDARYRRIRGGP